MNMLPISFIIARKFLVVLFVFISTTLSLKSQGVWPVSKVNSWYQKQGWLVGANFVPSTTINQLEMWQAETFDTATIKRELGWASAIGMNTMRVFLHHLAWQEDPVGFKTRMNVFLTIAGKSHIKPMFVFFDDCWNDSAYTGKQPEPRPGIHNSGWLQDPGERFYSEPLLLDTLEKYVKDIMFSFKNDRRILLWDLYNECGNNGQFEHSFFLLKKIFGWARDVNPDQPLTACYWVSDYHFGEMNAFVLSHSDIITYHSYEDAEQHEGRVTMLKVYGRPLICTEYMARKHSSTFFTILPLLKAQHIGAINWGLVDGKTQTKYAWDEKLPDGSEPKLWFHDVFHKDGTPYNVRETDFIKNMTR